jgi:hypothetical protein
VHQKVIWLVTSRVTSRGCAGDELDWRERWGHNLTRAVYSIISLASSGGALPPRDPAISRLMTRGAGANPMRESPPVAGAAVDEAR